MSQITSFVDAVVNVTGPGDQTIITAPTNGPIRVWKIVLTVSGATTMTFKHGTTAFNGPFVFTANGSSLGLYYDGSPHFTCKPAENFVMNLSAAVTAAGIVYYTLGG